MAGLHGAEEPNFPETALEFAQAKTNLRLIDGDELIDLILEHYEEFDPSYKGLLPLQRVYVPVDIGGTEGEE